MKISELLMLTAMMSDGLHNMISSMFSGGCSPIYTPRRKKYKGIDKEMKRSTFNKNR